MKNTKRFTEDENHAITTAEALTFIKQYREHYGPEAAPGVFFDKQAVRTILDQPDAVGLRYYYGTDDFDQTRLVIVGASANLDDLLEGEPVKASVGKPPMTDGGLYNPDPGSHEIPLAEAAQLTNRYQEGLQPGQIKGGFFGKKAIQKLLDYPECTGLRFFFGAKKEGKRVVVILCVDKFGTELFYGPMLDLSVGCPPFCAPDNLLNHRISVDSKRSTRIAA